MSSLVLTDDVATIVAVSTAAAVFFAVALGGFIETMRLRNVFPIKGRSIPLLTGFWLPCFLVCTWYPISGLFLERICVAILLELHASMMAVNAILARSLRLWYLYYEAQERVALIRHKENNSNSSGSNITKEGGEKEPLSTWFIDHKWLVSDKCSLFIFLAFTFVEYCVAWLLFFLGPDDLLAPGFPECPTVGTTAVFASVAEVVACGAFVATMWRLRFISDNFKLKTEMLCDLVGGAFLALALDLHRFLPIRNYTKFPVILVLIVVPMLAVIMSMFYYPVILARRHLNNPRGRYGQSQQSFSPFRELPLKEVLTQPEHATYKQDFMEHLAREFALENVQFWFAVQRYERMWKESSMDEAAARALMIFDSYVQVNSTLEANVDHDVRMDIVQQIDGFLAPADRSIASRDLYSLEKRAPIKKPPFNLYSRAAHKILNLLENDTYRRWQCARKREGSVRVPSSHRPNGIPRASPSFRSQAASSASDLQQASVSALEVENSSPPFDQHTMLNVHAEDDLEANGPGCHPETPRDPFQLTEMANLDRAQTQPRRATYV